MNSGATLSFRRFGASTVRESLTVCVIMLFKDV